jgi:hypothetical protein
LTAIAAMTGIKPEWRRPAHVRLRQSQAQPDRQSAAALDVIGLILDLQDRWFNFPGTHKSVTNTQETPDSTKLRADAYIGPHVVAE